MEFFTVEKITKQLQDIRKAIHRLELDVPRFKYIVGECTDAECPEYDDREWAIFNVGEYWGGYDQIVWFRAWVNVPPELMEKKLRLRFLVGPRDGGNSTAEAMLYVNGFPLQAIDVFHEEAWLPPETLHAGRLLIAVRAWSGVYQVPDRRRFKLAQLIWIDEATENFYHLADTVLKSVNLLDTNDLRRAKLLHLLNQSFRRIDFANPHSEVFYRSVAEAAHLLVTGLAKLEQAEIKPRVVAIGHAHIDMAWLWRIKHTRDKAARTFATVLHLMRQYPEYRFMHSSPQLYKYLEQDHPYLFHQVKNCIASGNWEATGGMWVEADTNLPGGESLIRQFLFGKRYFRDKFGVENNVLWLPDVFGYSWSLPQIARNCGIKYFMTTKVSWNQFNRFPYDTFLWRGIDGSQLLAHFVTTPGEGTWFYTYNGQLTPAEVKGLWDNYRQKEHNDELLFLFGWGDGGGGPTREMLESGRALANLPGIPYVEQGKVEPFFERLEARIDPDELPVWDGELYLEYHRGTYTSQAAIKRANRNAEKLFHNAEWLASLAELATQTFDYPEDQIRKGWELILLNQFHDILPGSSIRPVYEDSFLDYQVIDAIGREIIDSALRSLAGHIGVDRPSLVVFNSLSWARSTLLQLPLQAGSPPETVTDPAGKPLPLQIIEDAGERKLLVEVSHLPPLGYRTFGLAPSGPEEQDFENNLIVTPDFLENSYYRVSLNTKGQITSLFDKRFGREVIAGGSRGNVFQVFEDRPMQFDAWDVDIYYQEKMQEIADLISVKVEESGPLRGVLLLEWAYLDSLIRQRLILYRSSPRIDFRTEVDWHQKQLLLKVAFPVAVRSTRATYDIQFGNIERPTHWNTSWDYARFEVVAHKWVDLSEGNYGVSLLNDCKYGHDVRNNVLRMTLIKSSINPDEKADQGRHAFTYSLLPHAGDWRTGDVARQAYELNFEPLVHRIASRQEGVLPPTFQLATVDAENVIIETVKKAEGGNAWVFRLYEYKQCHTNQVRLSFALPITGAAECNLVEEEEVPIAFDPTGFSFPIAPYEIKTFKVWF